MQEFQNKRFVLCKALQSSPTFGQFHFSKNNVSLFSAMCSHCHYALEDEAPIRHLTAADHKFRTDTNPLITDLQDIFFPSWILWPLILYQTLFTYTNGVLFYAKQSIHWYLPKMTNMSNHKMFINTFKTDFIFNLQVVGKIKCEESICMLC